jgi:hypothetical protein
LIPPFKRKTVENIFNDETLEKIQAIDEHHREGDIPSMG